MNKQPVVLILLNTLKFSSYQAQNFSMVAIYLNNIHLSQTAAGDFDQYLTEMIHTFQGSVKALTTQKGLFQWQLSNFDNNHNWASYFHTSSANFDKIPRSQQWWNDVTFFFFTTALLYCPTGISTMGNLGCFPSRKPVVTELCYPTCGARWVFLVFA